VLLHSHQPCRRRLCPQQHPIRWAAPMGQSLGSKAATGTDMGMGGAITAAAATTTVGTAAITMVGGIIAISRKRRHHSKPGPRLDPTRPTETLMRRNILVTSGKLRFLNRRPLSPYCALLLASRRGESYCCPWRLVTLHKLRRTAHPNGLSGWRSVISGSRRHYHGAHFAGHQNAASGEG
jgi:hypothetical protein